jgi:hypothetical protein
MLTSDVNSNFNFHSRNPYQACSHSTCSPICLFIVLHHTIPTIHHHGQNISHDSPHNDIFHVATTLLNHFLQVYKMLAQNPDGDTITAQEFAAARQDLTNLLQNTGGYVPEQVATINERVRVSEADAAQLQRQRQRERIARQQRFAQASNLTGVLSAAPDPGLGSVAFGLGSDERNALTDFADSIII